MINKRPIKSLLKKLVSYDSYVYIKSKKTWKLKPYIFIKSIIISSKQIIDNVILKCVPIIRDIDKFDEKFINSNLSDVVCFSNKFFCNILYTK